MTTVRRASQPSSLDLHIASGGTRHIPVLLTEVLAVLTPKDGDTFLDGTFGAGGYASALLNAASSSVLGLDRDPTALAAAAPLIEAFAGRLTVREACFGDMAAAWVAHAPAKSPTGIVLDIGVSSMQIDTAERGFSFMQDGPLDMRMGGDGASAADLLATLSADAIADILYQYGDERRSRAIARIIVASRLTAPLRTTRELTRLIEKVLGPPRQAEKHPATRTFQALRIAVNDELGELRRGLAAAEALLSDGGKLAVVTFHSLEDRIVKEFFRDRTGNAPRGSRYLPSAGDQRAPSFRFVNPKPLSPGADEVLTNPRARSARLRWAVRTAAAAWGPIAPH